MALDLALQFGQFVGEFLVQGQRLAQPHEHAHDGDIHLHSPFTSQDTGKHGHARLGKRTRPGTPASNVPGT
jgi:hypothetical protein